MNLEMRLTPDVLFMIVDLHTILSCEEKMFDWLLRKNPKLDKRGDGVTPLILNSSTTVLASQMKLIEKQSEGSEHLDVGVAMAASATAKGIADLVKTKCQMLRLHLDMTKPRRRRRKRANT